MLHNEDGGAAASGQTGNDLGEGSRTPRTGRNGHRACRSARNPGARDARRRHRDLGEYGQALDVRHQGRVETCQQGRTQRVNRIAALPAGFRHDLHGAELQGSDRRLCSRPRIRTHHDNRARHLAHDEPDGGEPIEFWHLDVHRNDVGGQLAGLRDGIVTVPGRGHDPEPP
jgi:hypothetical protein